MLHVPVLGMLYTDVDAVHTAMYGYSADMTLLTVLMDSPWASGTGFTLH